MKKIIVLIIAIFTISIANAQWQQINMPVWTLINCFTNSDSNLYAGTYSGIFLSTNNGNSWVPIDTGLTNTNIQTIAISGNNIFAGSYGGGVFLSTNNGNSWVAINNGLSCLKIITIVIRDSCIFAGTEGGGVFLTTNNGLSWTAVNNGLYNDTIFSLVISGTNIFAGTRYGGVYLSTNNGTNWTAVNSGLTYSNSIIWTMAANGQNVFIANDAGGIYLSNDNGTSWINKGLEFAGTESLIINGNKIFAGTSKGVFLSIDNGTNWIAVNDGLNDTLYVDPDYIFAYPIATCGDNIFVALLNPLTAFNDGIWRRPLSELTSIKENAVINNISIYPNPTKDNLTIETNSNTEQRLEILNLIGQIVYTSNINKKATVNTSAFAKGVYILKLSSDKETIVRKFIKE